MPRSKTTLNSTPTNNGARVLLKDQAYEALKSQIITGELSPNSFLSERQLAQDMGMSNTPVRSAIERLAHEGFVLVSPQQGIVVRTMSLQEINDHFDIRLALESFVVKRLVGNVSKADVALLNENLLAQAEAAQKDDLAASVALDIDFHMLLCKLLGNQDILKVMLHQSDKLKRMIFQVTGQNLQRMKVAYEEHAGIVDAIISDNAVVAAKRMEDHLTFGKEFLLNL
ncbi:MAG: GntR family transcriptional regulator [Deinococcota bacterium]